jgi:hypothetical protein
MPVGAMTLASGFGRGSRYFVSAAGLSCDCAHAKLTPDHVAAAQRAATSLLFMFRFML